MPRRKPQSFSVDLQDGQEWVECPADDCRKGYLPTCQYCDEDEDHCDCTSRDGFFCPTCAGQGGFDV